MSEKLETILADCLRERSDAYTAKAILKEFPTVRDIMNASEDELRPIKGVGPLKAKQIKAITKFAKYAYGNTEDKVTLKSPEDAYNFIRGKLEILELEQFHVIGLNTKNAVVFEEIVSQGSINASIVTPRETFNLLIRRRCAGAIVAHNHPSGDCTPSKEDIDLTDALVNSGKIIGIPILDHVIVGQGKYYSFKEHGLL